MFKKFWKKKTKQRIQILRVWIGNNPIVCNLVLIAIEVKPGPLVWGTDRRYRMHVLAVGFIGRGGRRRYV